MRRLPSFTAANGDVLWGTYGNGLTRPADPTDPAPTLFVFDDEFRFVDGGSGRFAFAAGGGVEQGDFDVLCTRRRCTPAVDPWLAELLHRARGSSASARRPGNARHRRSRLRRDPPLAAGPRVLSPPGQLGRQLRGGRRALHTAHETAGVRAWGVGGGDFGAGVAAHMARLVPDRLTGLHLTTVEIGPDASGAVEMSPEEEAFLARRADWAKRERGYWWIQSTKPQTLGYGLTDSPAGLAAWLLEKWRSWTNSRGDPAAGLSTEFLATLVTIYWVTGSITTSMRDSYDNRWHGAELPAESRVDVPTAIALFGHHFVPEPTPPRRWVERLYNVQTWTVMPAGGHSLPRSPTSSHETWRRRSVSSAVNDRPTAARSWRRSPPKGTAPGRPPPRRCSR